jgi:hypothetical protein
MSPKNKKTSQTSTALYHRVRSHDTKISKPEKHLHETLANAFEAGVRQGKKESEVCVTVNAAELRKFMRKVFEEDKKEKMKSELELAVWEARYKPYFAYGLAKVRETPTWKKATQLRHYSWADFKTQILSLPRTDPIAIKYRRILKVTAKEAGFTLRDVITAIDFSTSRCSSRFNHAEFGQDI